MATSDNFMTTEAASERAVEMGPGDRVAIRVRRSPAFARRTIWLDGIPLTEEPADITVDKAWLLKHARNPSFELSYADDAAGDATGDGDEPQVSDAAQAILDEAGITDLSTVERSEAGNITVETARKAAEAKAAAEASGSE